MGLDKNYGAEEIEKIIMGDYELISLKNFFLDLFARGPISERVFHTLRKGEIIGDEFWSGI